MFWKNKILILSALLLVVYGFSILSVPNEVLAQEKKFLYQDSPPKDTDLDGLTD